MNTRHVVFALLACATSIPATAQDALIAGPQAYKLKLENDWQMPPSFT